MYTTPEVSAEIINQAFIDKLDAGMVKEAQEAGSAYIRTQLREEGVLRRLWDPRTVTADELDPNLDDDKPSILCEIEPDAPSATFVPFKGTGERAYFKGKRFRIPFGKVESERLTKSKFELMTIRMDIMQWLKENQVKAVQEEEDGLFMETVQAIIAANLANQAVNAGAEDTFKDAFVLGLKGMTALKLPVGKILMGKNSYYDSTKLKVEHIGDAPQAKRFSEGVDDEESFMGYPVVTSIKAHLIPEGYMWFFPPQEYFCKFMMLQDATLYLKVEADMITFHTYEAPGFGIGNTLGCFRVKL